MLPLTPPNDYSDAFDPPAEAINRDDGVTLIGSSQYSAHQDYSIATPTSNNNMGLDSMDDRDMGERSGSQDLSDDDQDMSDGGANISNGFSSAMIPLHDGDVNASMGMLDTELVSGAEFEVPSPHGHSHAIMDDDMPYYYSEQLNGQDFSPYLPEDDLDNLPATAYGTIILEGSDATYPLASNSGLPAVISELSQQLQHIQDGQEHADFGNISDPQNWATDNSIPPFPLELQPFMEVENLMAAPSAEVSHESPHLAMVQEHISQTSGSTDSLTPVAQPSVFISPSTASFATNELLFSYFPYAESSWDDEIPASEADQIEVEDQFNLSLGDFLATWSRNISREEEPRRRTRGPALPAIEKQRDLTDLEPMEPRYLQGDKCDIQRLDWEEIGVTRLEAREMRRQTYKNYTNLRTNHRSHRKLNIQSVSNHSEYFKFRRMDFGHDVHLSHFQLRNLVACASRDRIFYAGKSQVMHYSPVEGTGLSNQYSVAMDLTQPAVQPFYGMNNGSIQISTMTIAHDVLVAGGFCGEYGIVNLKASRDTKHVEGIITDDSNAITNHVQVHLSRGSSLPLAAFASNDRGVRIVDVNTNQIIADHKYEHAINCTAISPDQRLRVLTGDTRRVLICNSETGEVLQELDGHQDYGFACDWADDGWTVATGNQDMLVKIWDARKWTDSRGAPTPVATIASEIAGVRKLKFSPLGSGKRVLIAAEPADFVHVIDGETFANKQTLSFFGEIGGVDFTNNGRDLIIANCDSMRGGIMEYERCGLASDAHYHADEPHRRRLGSMPGRLGYDWISDDEDSIRHSKSRGTKTHRKRKAAMIMTDLVQF